MALTLGEFVKPGNVSLYSEGSCKWMSVFLMWDVGVIPSHMWANVLLLTLFLF